MSNERRVVITVCGHKKSVDKIAIKVFDNDSPDDDYTVKAENYCDAINNLELKGDTWAVAQVITEDRNYKIKHFIPFRFDSILDLDDKAIQKILREVDSIVLAKALKGTEKAIQEKIFGNISKRAAEMLKEDMEYMGLIPASHVEEAQKKILDIVRYLTNTGEIIVGYDEGELIA
ncbi:MAG: hypothetical protein FWD36_09010 [Treponema sp.]|nr:hypothetical protein [Treponema sp.]